MIPSFVVLYVCINRRETTHFILEDILIIYATHAFQIQRPGRVAQLVGHLTRKSGVLGSIPGLATYFRFSFRFLLAKVCARSTG